MGIIFVSFQTQPAGCSIEKAVLKNFAMFTGIHLCWSLFLIIIQARNFIKKRLQQRYILVNISKFSRAFILKNICERLLLLISPIMRAFLNTDVSLRAKEQKKQQGTCRLAVLLIMTQLWIFLLQFKISKQLFIENTKEKMILFQLSYSVLGTTNNQLFQVKIIKKSNKSSKHK